MFSSHTCQLREFHTDFRHFFRHVCFQFKTADFLAFLRLPWRVNHDFHHSVKLLRCEVDFEFEPIFSKRIGEVEILITHN